MGKVLNFIPSANGERREFTCIGSARLTHFTNSGTPDNTKGSQQTAFEAEPNHSHILVLDDGTNWTAPGLELEFRARLEELLENGFQKDVECAPLKVPDLSTAALAVEGETENTSACAEQKAYESIDEEEERLQQLSQRAKPIHESQASRTKPVCVIVIGGSFGAHSIRIIQCD